MLRNRLYFGVKPLLPGRLRMAIRRAFAWQQRRQSRHNWPILPGSERPPEGWRGWPEQKQFALVLTHDVESAVGLSRVKMLAQMEMDLGFRSSFNFVPEGGYLIPAELRGWLEQNGFEVGVHDLHHDGGLYDSRAQFVENARRINAHLKEWNVVGFRSGFMLRNLEWLHDLNIEYDASTFDTDPFEPQPDGVRTIFPFWVSSGNGNGTGYVELPYTLPQDSTLFLLLREPSTALWWNKLEWLVQHGGMVLGNFHPDYMGFSDPPKRGMEFCSKLYRGFLENIKQKYLGRFWHVLPCELARFWACEMRGLAHKDSSRSPKLA